MSYMNFTQEFDPPPSTICKKYIYFGRGLPPLRLKVKADNDSYQKIATKRGESSTSTIVQGVFFSLGLTLKS